MSKKTTKRQRDLSVKLKASFAIQVHLDELVMIKETSSLIGELPEDSKKFIELMENTLIDSLKIIFPKPFDA